MKEYQQVLKKIEIYLKSNCSTDITKTFCNDYMDMYYNWFEIFEEELTDEKFEILDDINLLCDSYEHDIRIREDDKYTIGEKELVEKLKGYVEKLKKMP